VTATMASEPDEPACPHRHPAAGLAEVVLGDLQVVAADRFDGAIAPGRVDQLHPDRLAAPASSRKAVSVDEAILVADRHVILNDYTV
jgi:hypothetical protein